MQSNGHVDAGDPPIVRRARDRRDAVAIHGCCGSWTYGDLLDASAGIAARLLDGRDDLAEARVGLAIPPGGMHVAAQWGCWRAGGVVVPLSAAATVAELESFLADVSPAGIMVAGEPRPELVAAAERCHVPLVPLERAGLAAPPAGLTLPAIAPERRAMILCTSGTTSKPKGVVSTHAAITAQIEALVEAWRWTEADRIPLFLPLHHIHGIINVVACCLWAGGSLDAFDRFDAGTVVDRVAEGRYTVFMAVPTIYHRLLSYIESLEPAAREPVVAGFRRLRLMVSGSAALPVSVHEAWRRLTGQSLLERYGMTEIGMALSNPYDGERRPGSVGTPLPRVEVRLVGDDGEVIDAEGVAGEVEVRGPAVFREYWQRPETTAAAFHDGWFRTGDVGVLERGAFRILGRKSMDIIKSGGYKLSALEIEAALLDHPQIAECAVVGVPDEAWGELVAAVVVPRSPSADGDGDEMAELSLEQLRAWCRGRLSPYRIPRRLLVREALPRNTMGKVVKPAVVAMFARQLAAS